MQRSGTVEKKQADVRGQVLWRRGVEVSNCGLQLWGWQSTAAGPTESTAVAVEEPLPIDTSWSCGMLHAFIWLKSLVSKTAVVRSYL